MTGYRLSARAAEAEARRDLSLERKSVTVEGPDGARSDRDNFITNRITTETYDDYRGNGVGAALSLSATWACVSFWAGNIAGLPIAVYRNGPDGVAVEARDHPLFWLLHDSPNYDQSAFDFWEFMAACIELHGNAYAEIGKRDDGFIVSLTPVRPDLMNVSRLPSGDLGYRWNDNGRDRRVAQESILHIRGFGGGPLGGLSPLATCRRSFTSAMAVDRASGSMFANGVRSSGVMSIDKPLTGTQRPELEALLQEKFVGAQNVGRPMLLDNGLKWQQLSINPADAEMLESRKFGVTDICRVFEVDPHLVGHTEGNSSLGSSITDQTLSLLKFKLRKRLKRIEGALEKQLLTPVDRRNGVSIEFNLEGFLRADSAARATFYTAMTGMGAMSINEVRALEGLPPVAGGEVPRMQVQNQPITATPALPAPGATP
ncbi:phage portal protein [Sphingomonas montana]|uniref:phage portal protein n=1 Tax=Sphingomonas montana TaxID=1843236 RepID=UPI0009F835B2|nr:phage portal protein [Sphingomonas montana]